MQDVSTLANGMADYSIADMALFRALMTLASQGVIDISTVHLM
jgi:hypothetical protein